MSVEHRVYIPLIDSNVNALFDTGAQKSNFMRSEVAQKIESADRNCTESVNTDLNICGAFDSANCSQCKQVVTATINVSVNKRTLPIHTHFKVGDIAHYDMIIGYLTILENPELLRTMFLPEHLQAALNPKEDITEAPREPMMTPRRDGVGGAADPRAGHPVVPTHRTTAAEQPKRTSLDAGKQRRNRRARQQHNTMVHVIHEKSGTSAEKMSTADSDHEQGSIAPADAWEPWLLTDMKNGSSSSNRQAEPDEIKSNIPVGIFGSSTLSARLHQLCITHEKAFRRDLVCEPARVPPMKFTVNTNIWHDKKNKMPPRSDDR